jgi:hypothetical protein
MAHVERQEAFRKALVELVNSKIRESGITPEEAAQVFAEEAKAALDHLGWKPHSQRAASEHLVVAAACLKQGLVIPVPGFDSLFPDREAIH